MPNASKFYAFWRGCVRPDRPSLTNEKRNQRPPGFTLENAFLNFLNGRKDPETKIIILLDGEWEKSFYQKLAFQYNFSYYPIEAGSDKLSSYKSLEFIESLNLVSDDIVYLVEDDFLHLPEWDMYIRDGVENTPCEYVTLYDHPDKYFAPMYRNLESTLFLGKLTHWRTTPSTTNTFACTWETLKQDMPIHKRVCSSNCNLEDKRIPFTYDHLRFVELGKAGSTLVSCVPGRSTNSEPNYLSPFVDWSE